MKNGLFSKIKAFYILLTNLLFIPTLLEEQPMALIT
jgi:hypothetical protein